MAKIIFPSSFECDCGCELHFGENTIKEMKRMSKRKKVTLGEAEHIVIFYQEKAIEIICPKLGKCKIKGFR